jgi:hypothetical protein
MHRNCEVHGAEIFPVQVGMILRSHSITCCPALNEVVSSGSKTGHGVSRNWKIISASTHLFIHGVMIRGNEQSVMQTRWYY